MSIRVHRRPAVMPEGEEFLPIVRRLSSWSLTSRQVSAFLSKDRTTDLLVMCSEPGMGKSTALRSLASRGRKTSTVHALKLFGLDALTAARRLSRLARQVERERLADKSVVVVLYDVPAGDDAIVDREASSISRMVASEAIVAISLLPEDELLAERLDSAIRITAKDLLVTDVLELGPSDPLYDVRSLTGGIPALVSALIRDNGNPRSDALVVGSTYFEALDHLVGAMLRQRLLDDEVATRLAMLLLGRGTFDDIASVTCINPREIAAGLECSAPLFGVSSHEASFRCFGVDTVDGLNACSASLAIKVSTWESLFDSVVRVLVERGELNRAAVIVRISPSSAVVSEVLSHAEEFISLGEIGLIRRMAGPALAQSLISPERSASVEMILSALGDRGFRLPETWCLQQTSGEPCITDDQSVDRLLVACRAVLAGESVTSNEDVSEEFAGLSVHLQAIQLLRDGHFWAVQSLVGPHVISSMEGTLANALLRLDMDVAGILLGGDRSTGGSLRCEAYEILMREGYSAIRDEETFLLALDAFARGCCDLSSIDALVSESERSGNELVRVAALMMGAAVEYVLGDYRSAGLRSAITAGAASRAGFTHLEAEANVLCGAAAGSSLGLGTAPINLKSASDVEGLSVVVELVRSALGEREDSQRLFEGAALPGDELWLLRVLISGKGDVAERLRNRIPHAWARAVMPIPALQAPPGITMRPARSAAGCLDNGQGPESTSGIRLRLELLGGFTFEVDGETVPEWHIDRRGSKAMLVFIALHSKLSAKRYEIIEQLWPDCDYKAGLDRIYQATSTLRKEVEAMAPGADPFLSSRGDRSVSLDSTLIECDFSEFEDAAGKALASEGDDVSALEAALRAEKLYTGDLFVPTRDFTGYVVARRQELRELYADAMVAGAEAALRLGRYRISARLADAATTVDDLREDAVEVLIRSLRASGRVFEAEQRYKRYAVRFVDKTHMPPSKRLRKAISEKDLGREGGLLT